MRAKPLPLQKFPSRDFKHCYHSSFANHPYAARSLLKRPLLRRTRIPAGLHRVPLQMTSEGRSEPQSQNTNTRAAYFLRQVPLADPKASFEGKNVIVTGANTGLGFEAAKFATLDASQVILGVRDLTKGNHAKSVIEERTRTKDRVEVWHLDMNSYDSIQDFAQHASNLDHLNVAVLNAGVYMVAYEESRYGWEQTLQVNALSTALLGLLLLPKLKASKTENMVPVVEFVSSENHERVTLSPEQSRADNLLRSYNTAKGYKASQQSSDAASGKPGVVVTSVCPGYCKSDLSRGHKGIALQVIRTLANALFLRTTEEGSRSLVSGVMLGEEAHGRFWQNDQLKPAAPLLSGKDGEELRLKVWSEIVEGLRKDVPGISDVVAKLKA